MISVCVPVFNVDVRKLAGQLANEAQKAPFAVEIIFFDDYSDEKYRTLNSEISKKKGIIYKELARNTGRSSIRNALGKAATQPWLLFLDSDSELVTNDFLGYYIKAAQGAEVICGGTVYRGSPPSDKSTLLRWTYGRAREQMTALQRSSGNKFSITANNFMIRKDIFVQHPFREIILEYGHEDTVLGFDLNKGGVKVIHADNPVLHNGLEPSVEYLEKTRKALDNLVYISENIIGDARFRNESGFLKMRNGLKKTGLLPLAGVLFRMFEPYLAKNLTGKNPRLFLFDLYRTGYLCRK
jgi:glycosyltransferase involved in cell wall biosynthesis